MTPTPLVTGERSQTGVVGSHQTWGPAHGCPIGNEVRCGTGCVCASCVNTASLPLPGGLAQGEGAGAAAEQRGPRTVAAEQQGTGRLFFAERRGDRVGPAVSPQRVDPYFGSSHHPRHQPNINIGSSQNNNNVITKEGITNNKKGRKNGRGFASTKAVNNHFMGEFVKGKSKESVLQESLEIVVQNVGGLKAKATKLKVGVRKY